MNMYKIFFLFILISITDVFSQEIPNEFYQFHSIKLKADAGSDWSKNSTFGPVRNQNSITGNDSLKIISRLGSSIKTDGINLYGYGHFSFQSNFYGYLYSHVVTDSDAFERYSGINRDIKRGGFSSGETDLSGIGYQNNWMILQFGRGRQSWGAGNDIQLATSENSSSYDYGMLDLDFGKLRTRYFHGYLETDSLLTNRYITGRGIEWNNQRSLIIGLSEIVIYSGIGRSLDFSFLNPISTHLEIELNERQNNIDTGSGNGVWQISIDWLMRPNIRLSSNYLFDEVILDRVQKKAGKGNGQASSFKLALSPINNETSIFTLYTSYISVGTHTFRHEHGSNNFVQRKKPLGWTIGSDSKEIKIGANLLLYEMVIANLELGYQILGEKNIIESLYQPYSDYLDGPFPSGDLKKRLSTSGRLQWWIKKKFSILTNFEYVVSEANISELNFNVGIDIYFKTDSLL